LQRIQKLRPPAKAASAPSLGGLSSPGSTEPATREQLAQKTGPSTSRAPVAPPRFSSETVRVLDCLSAPGHIWGYPRRGPLVAHGPNSLAPIHVLRFGRLVMRFASVLSAAVLALAAGPAAAQETIDNLEFTAWSKYKKGASITLKTTSTFNGMTSEAIMT